MYREEDGRFTVILTERPVSANRKVLPKWRERVREVARRRMNGRAILQGRLYSRILWLHREPGAADVDNIAQYFHDALNEVVYPDDKLIDASLVRRVDLRVEVAEFRVATWNQETLEELEKRLEEGAKHVVYVEVGALRAVPFCAGPVEELPC